MDALATHRRALLKEADVRPRDLAKKWEVKSPTVTGILGGASRANRLERDLAKILTEKLGREITWESLFETPTYIRRDRQFIDNPQDA